MVKKKANTTKRNVTHAASKKAASLAGDDREGDPHATAASKVRSGARTASPLAGVASADPRLKARAFAASARRRAKPSTEGSTITLGDLAAGYLVELELRAASAVAFFRDEQALQAAVEALGKERLASKLRAEEVEALSSTLRVARPKDGPEGSSLSVATACRVLRRALVWAVNEGLLEKARLPPETPSS